MRAIRRAIIAVAGVDALLVAWWVGEYQIGLRRPVAQALAVGVMGLLIVAGYAVRVAATRRWQTPRPSAQPVRPSAQPVGASAQPPAAPTSLTTYRSISDQVRRSREAINSVTAELPLLAARDQREPAVGATPAAGAPPTTGAPPLAYHEASVAITTYQKILLGREQRLGVEHEQTIRARGALAGAYWAAGQLDQAIEQYVRTAAESERTLGARHPYTLAARNDLAATYELAGRVSDAIGVYERNLRDCAHALGAEHPQTTAIRDSLAVARTVQANLGSGHTRPGG